MGTASRGRSLHPLGTACTKTCTCRAYSERLARKSVLPSTSLKRGLNANIYRPSHLDSRVTSSQHWCELHGALTTSAASVPEEQPGSRPWLFQICSCLLAMSSSD